MTRPRAKSREARQARKTLLEDIKSGAETVSAVVDRGQSDPVGWEDEGLPGYGVTRAHAVLQEAGIPEDRRVAGLGSRQRDALLQAVGRD